MPLRFIIFFGIIVTLLIAVHGYLGWRHITPSGLSGPMRTLAWVGVFLFSLLPPLAFTGRFFLKGTLGELASWAGYLAMGLLSFALVLTVLRDVAFLAGRGIGVLGDGERRTALVHMTNLAVLAASTGFLAVGVRGARKRADIVDVTVPIAGLPEALRGFVIVQLTDVHVGPTIKRGYIEAIVEAVNGIGADAIAITGDVVDGSVKELGEHIAPFKDLQAKHGVFFCTGNHEYYSGADAWIEELTRLGLRCLQNEHVVIDRDGSKLVIAGVHDYNASQVHDTHTSDPKAALKGAPDDAIRVLLAHQPRSCKDTDGCDYHLQLSGHTHGGQFVPWNLFVPLQQPFTAGLGKWKERMWVYTSRGTGYWGPPVRVGAPSEITRLTLVPA